MKKLFGAILLGAMIFVLSACGVVPIGKILRDPTRYQHRDVRIEGTVTNAFGAIVAGGYQVDDGTGKMIVVSTRGGVPSKGSRVVVDGRITGAITIMGQAYGTTLHESGHKVRDIR